MSAGTFYDTFYGKALRSAAHSEFCRKVYGKDLCQHGMADQEQIDLMIRETGIDGNSAVLDLGCGPGLISAYIQERTGCRMKGLDISGGAIGLARELAGENNPNLTFEVKDIGDIDAIDGNWDAMLSIDTHYFLDDFTGMIPRYLAKLNDGGVFAVFSDMGTGRQQYDESETKASGTLIGRYLDEHGIRYRGIELYREHRRHWDRKMEVLLELKHKFEAEGNMEIYGNRMEECLGECGTMGGRYLYLIYK